MFKYEEYWSVFNTEKGFLFESMGKPGEFSFFRYPIADSDRIELVKETEKTCLNLIKKLRAQGHNETYWLVDFTVKEVS